MIIEDEEPNRTTLRFRNIINKTSREVTSVKSQTEQTGFVTFHDANSLMQREIDLIDQDQCTAQLKSKVPDYIICSSGGSCHVPASSTKLSLNPKKKKNKKNKDENSNLRTLVTWRRRGGGEVLQEAGDSGGPLMYEDNGRWTLIGVISDGPDDCYHPEKPLLFVKVSHFVDSLISKFKQPGNHSDKNAICATQEARKECVTRAYQFHNYTLK
uniref:Putative serine protease n=1 Tax=Ixodes ricinus TaxID=34613 RepID=A0A0K8R341_IXORI